ncbi:MAG: hydroxymethylbilane synthase [Alphaproteobacteria bacterium]|nr:hydroxymethylbilane synthase [Alphaproteobacteria bacterium]
MQNRFSKVLRLGTRGSPLALAQTQTVLAQLRTHYPELNDATAVEIVVLKASGDHILGSKDERLVDVGGKGLFTKELEEALFENRIDIAVHSMKDVPTWLPQGLEIVASLTREDPRDVLITNGIDSLDGLPKGAVVGTSSLRRQAQLLNKRPDLKVVPLRGNIDTRIKKLEAGQVDATLLAYAGLKRIGLTSRANGILDTSTILPAVAQGIIGLEIRAGDDGIRSALGVINCAKTMSSMVAERAMLEVLDGSCNTPIAGLAVHNSGGLFLQGLVADSQGKGIWQAEQTAAASDAVSLGREVGRALRKQVPAGILPE